MIDPSFKYGIFWTPARKVNVVEITTVCKAKLIIRVRVSLLPEKLSVDDNLRLRG